MFKFKLSLSSFRLCRRKTKSPATACFFSPINPKVLEITYPTIPSPPPTTPTDRLHPSISKTPPLTTTLELHTPEMEKNSMGSSDETGLFGDTDQDRSSGVNGLKKVVVGECWSGGDVCSKVMTETLTVVKWSEQPYDDFKESMLEMILEKQMFEPKDLEQLLHCFLSLNSRHHHANIIAAFTEIWELLNL